MLRAGWIDEVRLLLERGTDPQLPGMASLGYPPVVAHVQGSLAFEAMRQAIARDTRRYARHQETWFRKFDAHVTLRASDAANVEILEDLLRPWVVSGTGDAAPGRDS
jgi:tRNA dimethylallyltransferase